MALPPKISFRIVWGIFMALAYAGIAYLFVFTPVLIRYNDAGDPAGDQHPIMRIVIGIVVFLYGIVRAYRACKELLQPCTTNSN